MCKHLEVFALLRYRFNWCPHYWIGEFIRGSATARDFCCWGDINEAKKIAEERVGQHIYWQEENLYGRIDTLYKHVAYLKEDCDRCLAAVRRLKRDEYI